MKTYNVIGLMSGTSLDGLDIAYCTFKFDKGKWQYSINCAETVKYNREWALTLKGAHTLSSEKLLQTHSEYGVFLGQKVNEFRRKYKLKKVDILSSHGHTIFHRPENGYTFQLGNGACIAASSGLKVVCDFRTMDVALKGQGAPLVPIGDKLLFPEYSFCLNLGGFSNISFEESGKRVAFDICPVNTVLNFLAETKGKAFDKDGAIAGEGKINKALLAKLNRLEYYKKRKPKSLGREWLSSSFLPVLAASIISTEDKLATVTEHIAYQISEVILNSGKKGKLLITGGGANNKFLVKRLMGMLPVHQVVIPAESLVNFKEALVFALLGVLKIEQKVNTLGSVTGAIKNSSGGVIFIPEPSFIST